MDTFVGLTQITAPPQGTAVTVGTFDGVHLGHRALITATLAEAQRLDAVPALVTWDRHPAATLRPTEVPPLLTSGSRKAELIAEAGIELLLILPFDKELSRWPPERFVADVLHQALGACTVVVGRDWRFGHKASGDVELLERLGAAGGYTTHGSELLQDEGQPVSSSRVRELIGAGDLEAARRLLGRPFDLDGVVIPGDKRGSTLGYPTANLQVDGAIARPPLGIYAGRARTKGRWYPAAISIGVNPTFGGDPESSPVRVEAYLLDFIGDLYGQELRLEFWRHLREERRFDSVEGLVAQMAADVEATRALTC